MQATVSKECGLRLLDDQGNNIKVEKALVLTSYKTKVAIYDEGKGVLYLLPEWNYSRSAIVQIEAFMEDCCSGFGKLYKSDIVRILNNPHGYIKPAKLV